MIRKNVKINPPSPSPCLPCRARATPSQRSIPPPAPPCPPCAIEHLDLAEAAQRRGDRYRAVWHLAQAAARAPQHQAELRAARISLQRINKDMDFSFLRQLIGGTHAEH